MSLDPFLIRRAVAADRGAVIALHLDLYIEHRESIMPEGVDRLVAYREFPLVLREDVDAMLRNPSTHIFLALQERPEGAQPIGYITGYLQPDPRRVLPRRGVLADWFVAPEARSQGVGRALLSALFHQFQADGCDVVQTATWPFNTHTRKTMERMGMREVEVVYRRELGDLLRGLE